MADSSPANALEGRTVALAGEPGALKDQVAACLDALGAVPVRLQSDASAGPEIADLKVEDRATAALDRAEAVLDGCDAIVFVGRDLADGEDMAAFIEESIGGYHLCLKLAKRLCARQATDVLAVAGALRKGVEQPGLAADVQNGALRQMTLVAATEGWATVPAVARQRGPCVRRARPGSVGKPDVALGAPARASARLCDGHGAGNQALSSTEPGDRVAAAGQHRHHSPLHPAGSQALNPWRRGRATPPARCARPPSASGDSIDGLFRLGQRAVDALAHFFEIDAFRALLAFTVAGIHTVNDAG